MAALVVAMVAVVALLWLYRPAFEVNDLQAPEMVVSGEPVPVGVELANVGRAGGEQELTLLVDGTPAATASATVAAGAEETVTLTVDDLAPGTYELSLADWEAPAGIVSAISPPQLAVPDAVVDGQEVVVDVTLTNDSRASLAQELAILIDGDPAESATVEMASGDQETLSFAFADLPSGTYELAVTVLDWASPPAVVWVFAPPQQASPEAAASGELLRVAVQLANDGQLDVAPELSLLVDGTSAASERVALAAGTEETVTLGVGGLTAGSYELAVALADWTSPTSDVWVFAPPVLELPDEVVGGEQVVIEVALANDGRVDVAQEVFALVDGSRAASVPVELSPADETTVSLSLDELMPGSREFVLALGDWQSPPATVQVLTPPAFEIDPLEVTPNPIDVSDDPTVTVTTAITNVGEASGTYSLEVQLDGTTVEERTVELSGGDSTAESLDITVTAPGSHEISIEDQTAALEAYQLQRPSNGTVVTNQLGGGENRLRVTNNDEQDVLVVLAAPGQDPSALLSVYVRSGSSHTVRGLRDGTYATYYAFGAGWCTHNKAFTRATEYGRFEDSDTYTTTATHYTQVDLEFGLFEGPGASIDWVDESDFPSA
jgi:hypothetical protein